MTSQWSGVTWNAIESNFKILFVLKAPPELALTSFHYCRTPGSLPGDGRKQNMSVSWSTFFSKSQKPSKQRDKKNTSPNRVPLRKGKNALFPPPSPLPLAQASGIKYIVEPINAGHSTEVKKIQVRCVSSLWPVKWTLRSPPLQSWFCVAAIWSTLVLCFTVQLCVSGRARLIPFHSFKDNSL